MANKDPNDAARERIEAMQRLSKNARINPHGGPFLIDGNDEENGNIGPHHPDNGDNMAEPVSVEKYELLKRKFESLKRIIINSLIALDWTFKVGTPVALFFWPIPQDHLIQSIGLAIYVILLTIISKTITKVSVHTA